MPSYARNKMCGECPFRADAAPGWLGPWSAEEIEEIVLTDQNFICHTDIDRMKEDGIDIDDPLEKDIAMDLGQHCVGAMRYMNQHFKLSRDKKKAEAQQRLKAQQDQDVIPARKFVEYHNS